MSNKKLWITLIKSTVKCDPKFLSIVSEHKEQRYYQAKLVSPVHTIYGEPALSEDNAFESLLSEVRRDGGLCSPGI